MKEQQPLQDNSNYNYDEEKEATMNNNSDMNQEEISQEQTEIEVEDNAVHEAGAEEEVTSEVEQLRAEAEEHQQRLLRAQADFDNFRRRTLKEKEELAKYASSKLINELLPVFDNFQRALTTSGDVEISSYTKGVEMIFRQFEGVLKAEGLESMEVVGEPFNPEYHQAIMQVESDEYEEGIVVEEVQKGYILKDKVLRPAMVKVSG